MDTAEENVRKKAPWNQEWTFILHLDFIFNLFSHADMQRSESCAVMQQEDCCMNNVWCSSPLDPGEKSDVGTLNIEHTDWQPAYMMELCHVATAPPLFRSAHATVHVMGLGFVTWAKFGQHKLLLQNSHKKRKRLLIWFHKLRVFSACDTTRSVFLVPILCVPGKTALVCDVNEALPGCQWFYLMLLFC